METRIKLINDTECKFYGEFFSDGELWEVWRGYESDSMTKSGKSPVWYCNRSGDYRDFTCRSSFKGIKKFLSIF